jgi:hypothetical protein
MRRPPTTEVFMCGRRCEESRNLLRARISW